MATMLISAFATAGKWNWVWSAVGALAGNYIDQKLFGTNTDVGGRLSDLNVQTASSGVPIQRVWGKVRCDCNVIWATNYIEHKHETSAGGKGGGDTATNYTYTISFAVSMSQGPIKGIGRIWADGNLIDLSSYSYTLYLGTEAQTTDSFIEGIEGSGNVPPFKGLAYIVFHDMDVTDFGSRIPSLSIEVFGEDANLPTIITEISADMGLDAASVDVTGLAGVTIPGYSTTGDKTGREQVQNLQNFYLFDGVEIDGKVVFKPRNYSSVYPIALEDMGAYESTPPDEPYTVTRTPDIELPKSLTLNYLSAENDYQQGTVTARRALTSSVGNSSISAAYTLADAAAKSIADNLLYQAWIERKQYDIDLSAKYAFLRPSNVVELQLANNKKELAVIIKTSFGSPGLIKLTAKSTYAAMYNLITRVVDAGTSSSLGDSPTAVIFEFLDIPQPPTDTTTTTDDTVYLATTGTTFVGAAVYWSKDNAVSYSLVTANNPQATMGKVANVLGDGTTNFWDNANTITVVLTSGTLSSYEEADVLNWANLAVVGNELLQFKSAVLVAANTYQLSGLLRGRLGTEYCTGSHVAGERFVFLTAATIGGERVPTSEWYTSRDYLIGPRTRANTDATYTHTTFSYQGNMAKPLAPCHVSGTRDSSGNLTLNWIRRTRKNGDWKDYVDVSLGESAEEYQIDIIKSGAVVRILTVTTPNVNYTVAQQVTDFGNAQSSIVVNIYQMSETRGRGTAKGVTV